MPFLHGSQGCATYIRRYMISHFSEPLDIASSNFGEDDGHLRRPGEPADGPGERGPPVRSATDRHRHHLPGRDDRRRRGHVSPRRSPPKRRGTLPEVVHVSTPSYAGTHDEGFHATVLALVETLAKAGPAARGDQRARPAWSRRPTCATSRTIFRDFGLEPILLPDYSDTLDGPTWTEYQRIPPGGTPIEAIRRMGSARATIEFGSTWHERRTRPGSCWKSGSACRAMNCRCRWA